MAFVDKRSWFVIGGSHAESKKPVQDYSDEKRGDGYSIAIVSDGHGGDRYFRSNVGSKTATEVTIDRLERLVKKYPDWQSFEPVAESVIYRLKLSILSEWQNRVGENARTEPFTEDEMKLASKSFPEKMKYNLTSAYGATLLAALVAKDYYLVLMLGDGGIIKLTPAYPANKAEIVGFEGKEKFADQPHSATNSLCEPNAFDNFFHKYKKIDESEKGIAFGLCSDGFFEAFRTDEDMLSTVSIYLNYYAENRSEEAYEKIKSMLERIANGSMMKDDTSLAYATLNIEMYDHREEMRAEEEAKAKAEAEAKAKAEAEEEARAKAEEEAKAEAEAEDVAVEEPVPDAACDGPVTDEPVAEESENDGACEENKENNINENEGEVK